MIDKPSLAILIGKAQQKPEQKQAGLKELLMGGHDDADRGSDNEHYQAAMQDFIDAVKGDDARAACEAFRDLQVLCPEEDEDDGDSGNEPRHDQTSSGDSTQDYS